MNPLPFVPMKKFHAWVLVHKRTGSIRELFTQSTSAMFHTRKQARVFLQLGGRTMIWRVAKLCAFEYLSAERETTLRRQRKVRQTAIELYESENKGPIPLRKFSQLSPKKQEQYLDRARKLQFVLDAANRKIAKSIAAGGVMSSALATHYAPTTPAVRADCTLKKARNTVLCHHSSP